jgi:hypothetical protein
MRYKSQQLGKTTKKTLFKAPDWSLRIFAVFVTLWHRSTTPTIQDLRTRRTIVQRAGVAVLGGAIVCVSVLSITATVESNLTFVRKLDRLVVLPGTVQSALWADPHNALVHDVREDALYQQFTLRNAATLSGDMLQRVPEENVRPDSSNVSETDTGDAVTPPSDIPTDAANGASLESSTPSDTPTESVAPDAIEGTLENHSDPVSDSDTPLEAMSTGFFRFVNQATRLLPFAQETIVEPVDDTPSTESEPHPASHVDHADDDTHLDDTEVTTESDDVHDEALHIEGETSNDTVTEEQVESDDTTSISEEEPLGTVSIEKENELVFTGFALPPLNSGQFIRNAQLRVSLAGSLRDVHDMLPVITVSYSLGNTWHDAGNVIFDEEISNALNGGNYLFALPTFRAVSELADFKVRIAYVGDPELLETLFVDAAWLEIDTETFDREILNQRLNPEGFAGFKLPEMYEFIGQSIDFAREEMPQFTLKYESQRNPIVGFFRDLFGRKLMDIERVAFMRPGGDEIEVDPQIDLTDDGLLSIQMTEEDMELLLPGKYEVSITVREGSKEYTDSFNFQWGVLAINPDQTTYTLGATSTIMMGVVSENGNTLCEAHLQLYIFDPTGYVHDAPVSRSGLCNGNNVTDRADYAASFVPTVPGTYEMYVEHIGPSGDVVAHTYDTFMVRDVASLTILRDGPTRINPRFEYPMTVTVTAHDAFQGELIERVPADFVVQGTDARIIERGNTQELAWDLDLAGGESRSFTYRFDAPDISPFLYNLGPAHARDGAGAIVSETVLHAQYLVQETVVEGLAEVIPTDEPAQAEEIPDTEVVATKEVIVEESTQSDADVVVEVDDSLGASEEAVPNEADDALSESVDDPTLTEGDVTGATTTDAIVEEPTTRDFEEHRQWQIASDATGSAILYWSTTTIPSGWTCVSCAPAGAFYQRFVVGSSTAGTNGGATTHTHTMSATVPGTAATGVSSLGGGGADVAQNGHTHTLTPTIGTGSNLPPYRNLVLIQHNSAGSPATIPAGAIAMFDAALPSGWSAYSAQNGFFPRAEATSTIGTTGGTSTHVHAISGTTGGPSTTTNAPNTTGVSTAINTHTHTVTGSSSVGSTLPPFIGAIFGQLATTSSPTDNMIMMWTDEPPTGWNAVSSSSGAFENRFVVASTTYGVTGGATTHTHADFTITTSGPSGSVLRTANVANADASGSHTHDASFTGVSTVDQLPPFRTAIFAKRSPGGAPPSAPTIHTPFDNERTGTSTLIVDFTGNDPDGSDTLVYQIEWDDDTDIASAPLGSRTSDNESGCSPDCFDNTVDGGDTHPFTNNQRIRFTATSSMTSNTTYYYRVRVKETIGNTWSSWSTVQSVTYQTGVSPSEWFQTEDYQFGLGTSTNASTSSNTVRLASTTLTSAPTIESFTSNTAVPGGSLNLTKPAGVVAGDLLLVIVGNDDDTASAQWDDATLKPTGFTLINTAGNATSDAHSAAFYRIADGTEGSSISVPAQSSDDFWGYYIHVTDVNPAAPINMNGTAYTGGALTTHAIPTGTTTVANALAFYVLAADGGDTDPFSVGGSWTEQSEIEAGAGAGNAAGTWGTRLMTVPGATSNASVTFTAGDSAAGFQFALAPAQGQGSHSSSPITFTSVAGQSAWGEATWNVTEPAQTNTRVQVLYTSTTTCDTLVSDTNLPGNSTGFTSSQIPLHLDTLSTSTHHTICLLANFDLGTGTSSPILEDWTVRWTRTPQFVQSEYRWYANNDTLTPTDPWPVGGTDLLENEPVDINYVLNQNDVIRLRMSLLGTSTDAAVDSSIFKLQYVAADTCSAADGWQDVGGTSSTTALWRGYNNASVADGSTLPSTLLTNSDHAETYEEQNNSFSNPVAIDVGEVGEWDWTIQHNGALPGRNYCFRMVHENNDPLLAYQEYPQLITDASPTTILYTPFDNEKISTTTPSFEFVGDDPEGADVDYQIQIDNDATFASTVIDTNSITNLTDFVNLVTPSDKSPFRNAERMRYRIPSSLTNGTTYWWRVRAIDSAGSGAYGEWATAQSFTIDTTVTVSTWFQTTEAQFDTDTLIGTDATGSNLVAFASGSTTGTTTSTAIDFSDATIGNAWGELSFTETGAANNILYRIEYYDGSDWLLIPDTALAGNSTGFDTSPITLIDVDSSTYSIIRLRANFLAGSPTLLDWTVAWGERVTVPTHATPFDNEKFATTTPFFTFSTEDPQGDDLEYEISWSTDPAFATGSTTRNSSTHAGFVNLDAGGDTDPFNSGDTIRFQVQAADALTASTTYWWRVRAKDPADSDSFSFWSTPWSFTTATSGESVSVSTWYQTTGDQFSQGTLANVTATTTSVGIGGGIALQNWTTNTAVPGATLSLTRPTGVTAGDLLLIIVGNDDNTANQQWNSTTLRPSGFNFINTAGNATPDAHVAAFYRIADGTEASSTSTPAQISADYWGYYIRVTGVSTTSPIDVIGADYNGTSLTTHNITAITTTIDQALAFYALSGDGGDLDPFSVAGAWTERAETEAGSGIGNGSGTWGTRLMTSAGSTGVAAVTMALADGAAGFQFALSPSVITSGTVTSPPIAYDSGDGPAWGAFSWRDNEPGASEILYRIEYLNQVGAWALIPDTALSGNSTGFTTTAVNLESLDTDTYATIRIVASLDCDGANCPTLYDWTVTWSGGFVVSGTAYEYDGISSTTAGTVAIAVNGSLQSGKTSPISSGTWSIPNVTFFEDDIITVFVQGAASADEAVAVTEYDGTPGISGLRLQKRHLTLGSDDLATLTNSHLALYDFTHTEDIFFDVNGSSDLTLCADTGCSDASLRVRSGNSYTPGTGADITTYNLRNDGVFTPGSNTVRVGGSWTNTATTTMTGSTVIFTATSSGPYTLDESDSLLNFNTLTFGEGSGTATWSLSDPLDVDGVLTVAYGTLDRAAQPILTAVNVTTGANGYWTGIGTTTFDGINPSTWTDSNAVKQNIGHVVVDGTAKTLLLGSNTLMQSLRIAADDVFDLSVSGHTASVLSSWTNLNSFVPRTGTVAFSATTSSHTIQPGASAFYNLTFNGAGGAWSFGTATVTVQNNFTIATGTVTMPTGTTTISGSFLNTGGTFAHNNASIDFTGSGAKSVTQNGTPLTNAFYNVRFAGAGSWSFTEANATTTNLFTITQGSVTLPSSTLAIGNSFTQSGGSFAHNNGAVRFTGSGTHTIDVNGSSFNDLLFTGSGARSFLDASLTVLGDLTITNGTLTMPTGTLTLGGSLVNDASLLHASGTVLFNSSDTGESIDMGTSSLHNATFSSATGGWTIADNATTTGTVTLTALSDFTLTSGRTLSVGSTFTNSVGGASTTWSGSTLSLEGGNYSINTKTNAGDAYGTLRVATNADIRMWHSTSSAYTVAANASLYSQDHNAVDGDLYIWGDYERTTGTEYWSYTTDFDGTALTGGSERQVDVRIASGAAITVQGSTLHILGGASATTTIANQGSGTYALSVASGTVNAQYYQVRHTNASGLLLSGSTTITSLTSGDFELGTNGGTLLTVSSTTINHNPALQIQYVRFATSTGIATGTSVTQSDGTPASYWWFRNAVGNLSGEAYDNDTGNPGSIRWDDSQLLITLSGTVYSDDGVTPMGAPVCDGSTQSIRVVVQGGSAFTGSCTPGTGSYSISNISFTGDPVLSVYLDTNGGARGAVVTKTPTANITNFDIYQNRVITRHEDVVPLTILDLAVFDADNDTDIPYTAATGTLSISGAELHVASSTTFAPGGDMTLHGNASSSSAEGSIHIDNGAHLLGAGTSTYTLAGNFTMDQGASFTAASTTVVMNATTTGKTITTTSGQEILFNTLRFTGVGGGWNINGTIRALAGIASEQGTVSGTSNVTVSGGSWSGNGTVSMGGGTTTIERTNTLGGTTPWTFNNLVLGSGVVAGTTTPGSQATTTILGRLTIANAHTLALGGSRIDLRGSGSVFVETGTLAEGTSTIRYSGTSGSNVLATTYYNLEVMALGNAPTFTALGGGINILNDVTVGGATTTTFTLTTNDPVFDVQGSVRIDAAGSLIASDSAAFTVAGNWDSDGVFTHSGGTITFDGGVTTAIAPGSSPFANVTINGAGAFTITEHATGTGTFTLTNAGSFTLASGQTLAVGGAFTQLVSGGLTTWTGSTLALYGGGNYTINSTTTSDTYETLRIGDTTQIRMWNSSANTYTVASTGSLYSQDHAAVNGELYIFGLYQKTAGADHWSYATDFDGTDIGGSPRTAAVRIANGATVRYLGGSLAVTGGVSASTTIQNQGTGTYALDIGGSASTTWSRFVIRNTNANGLVFGGTPTVGSLGFGDFEVAQNGWTAMTVGGTVITQNSAKTFTGMRFATSTGVSNASNVTATGTTVSSWRFTNHAGAIAGEAFDSDPTGDPGYLVWDDSAALITISGNVYSDEGIATSSVCDGTTQNIHVRVAGLTSYTTSCATATGAYSVPSIAFGPADSIVVYIDGESEQAAAVTVDPVSNITDMHLYENRVIVRHENSAPISIADMAVWDSSDDADIPFTAVDSSPDTLTLPANRKLIVWTNKEFEPAGNLTLSGGGGGAAYDGTLELYTNGSFDTTGSESHTIGGSLIMGAGASFDDETGTLTFTTTGSGRTVDSNDQSFHNLVFNGSGSWNITNTSLSVGNDLTITQGALAFPAGTTTISGSLLVNGGSFNANGGVMVFDSTSSETIRPRTSAFGTLIVAGSGTFTLSGGFATTTGDMRIHAGSFTSATGTLTVGGNFVNAGTFSHANGTIRLTGNTATVITASSSDLYSVTTAGTGPYTFTNTNLALLGTLRIESGSVTLPSGTTAVGGSFLNLGGSFTTGTGTILFNSTDTGETINPGASTFHNVTFGSGSGGWTIAAHATGTGNVSLTSASQFTLSSGATLAVQGAFTNLVGGGATTWTGSTLAIHSGTGYTINTKTAGGDAYNNLIIGSSTALRAWDSSGTVSLADAQSSLYSQDHAGVSGALNIYGDYSRTTGADYWSYATDFDGTALGGSSRQVTVRIANGATTTMSGSASLQIVGTNGFETNIQNQGSGTYALHILGGTLNALQYTFANMDATGLTLQGTTTVTSLSEGGFTLGVNGGTLISLASTTLNHNAGLVIVNTSFATTSAITGFNVTLNETTLNAWTFTGHSGNLAGEAYDVDGGDACGSIRWENSVCLLTQQSGYRFRADDGGEGVPDSEWLDTDWAKRMRVTFTNDDAVSYTDATLALTIPYDSDMQGDFDDLRFTQADGVTPIAHFTETYTASSEAYVWVEVPLLATSTDTAVFMYYGNGAAGDASATSTFRYIDTFEDGNLAEYSGDTSLFTAGTSFGYERDRGLDAAGNESQKTTDGIYRTNVTVSQGEKIRYLQYIDTTAGSGDETCALFGVQSPGSNNQNYAVCLELFGVDRVSIARNVDSNDTSGTILASSTITYTTGWYEVEVDWQTDDTIDVAVSKDGTLVATTTATDGTYTQGGVGFTFWFQNGGWDVYASRLRLDTEPSVTFGAEQVSGGASWLSALNTPHNGSDIGDTMRVRFLIENTGLQILDQNYEIEYAAKGSAPSCEAVSASNYVPVPPQASCGTSPVCMVASTQFTSGALTTDLLGGSGTFVPGRIIEDPDNTTADLDIDTDEFTELEYALTPTINVADPIYCLRVSDEGSDLDAYARIAEFGMVFTPTITTLSLNGGSDIILSAGGTTTIHATGTVSDLNGYTDLGNATTTIFRSGVGATCTADNNNCYIAAPAQCVYTNCSGASCTVTCSADMYYHADPTDIGTYAGETWRAELSIADLGGSVATATAPSIDLLTLRALSVDSAINYGALQPDSNTGAYNATTTIANIGNDSIDVSIEGTDLTDGGVSAIPVTGQRYATSTFTYSSCVICGTLSTTPANFVLDLGKPASTTPPVTDDVFWGIAIPFGTAGTAHQGVNTFYAIGDL